MIIADLRGSTECLTAGGNTVITNISTKKLRFGIILLPQFTLSAFSLFLDCLRLAADEKDQSRQIRCSWDITTLTGDKVQSSTGMFVEPTAALGSVFECDYVVVVGGLISPHKKAPAALVDLLRNINKREIRLIGLCTGTFALAEASVLPENQCCVSWLHTEEFGEEFFEFSADSISLYRANGKHYTCAGGMGSAYLALEIIAAEFSEELARKCASIMMIPFERRTNEQPALIFSGVSNRVIKQALRVFEATMEDPISMFEVSRRIGITCRQMERIFKEELGKSPLRVRDRLRVRKAKQLLLETDLNFTEIAVACGLLGTKTLNRAFAREGEKLPRELRASRVNVLSHSALGRDAN
jgi:transcriptional regulator GlxA family with amidase domain